MNSIAWNYTTVAIQEQNQRRGGGSLTYRSSSGGSLGAAFVKEIPNILPLQAVHLLLANLMLTFSLRSRVVIMLRLNQLETIGGLVDSENGLLSSFTLQVVYVFEYCYTLPCRYGFSCHWMLGCLHCVYRMTRLSMSIVNDWFNGIDTPGNTPGSTKEPAIGWMTAFLFVTSFVGLLALVPIRKIMIIDYKLTYPSGTATAVLINGFHTPKGDVMAKKQVHGFVKFFASSFVWAFFQWFFTGGDTCGFVQFPTFGLQAWKNSFYFDFSMTYVGAGMICSHLVNLSLLLGAVVSWGIMWPLIRGLKGEWFPANIKESSMKSLNGYKVFISIALILGDGFYNFVKVLYFTATNIHANMKKKNLNNTFSGNQKQLPLDDLRRNEMFARENIPIWLACTGYIFFSVISIVVIPLMFPQVKWYFVLFAYIFAPSLGFCNAYGAGLTDMNMAYNYGKVALFVLAALAGKSDGVVAGLVGCGLIKSIVSISSDLMHDLMHDFIGFLDSHRYINQGTFRGKNRDRSWSTRLTTIMTLVFRSQVSNSIENSSKYLRRVLDLDLGLRQGLKVTSMKTEQRIRDSHFNLGSLVLPFVVEVPVEATSKVLQVSS
ncbi:Metal-nicotianamine transporter ysl3 [Lathyrus oleraceus]|uniref:Metal-nicotianamine transporter ysl3 n=1 Tax=Pisum sativum TaxID=3888 RepID=A0A9D5A8J5_PEA|nr:Metal-nicotianamine transporter ysl3 [Pisum sativum]